MRPLTNDGWGFDSNCFVCEPRNSGGFPEAEIVRADGPRCVAAHAVFTGVDLDQASDAAGADVTGDAVAFTKPGASSGADPHVDHQRDDPRDDER